MSNINENQIRKELRKWVVISQKFRTSSVIIEAKLKSHMVVFESKADRNQINQLQSEIGNLFRINLTLISIDFKRKPLVKSQKT